MAGIKILDTATVAGIGLGVGSLVGAMTLEFGHLNPDLGTPFLQVSALLIIFGGTFGCTLLSFRMDQVLGIPTLVRIALFGEKNDPKEVISELSRRAELARREGILALESQQEELKQADPFLGWGFGLIIDGQPPEFVKDLLLNEISNMEERHHAGAEIFTSLGGYAPTMGIIGTVVGLIAALAKAGEGGGDPTAVVEAIATAFIATFYGIASANLIFLPLATKLQRRSKEEAFNKLVQTEGILSIQNGLNPRVIQESLKSFYRRQEVA